MRAGVYDNSDPFELNQGLVRLHNAVAYRTMLLDTAIKPVIRVSNMDAQTTRAELERYRGLGYHAAPCHAAYSFDEDGLYQFDGDGTLFYIFASASEASLAEMLEVDRAQKTDPDGAHKLDHALEVGRLLGYPACCTRSYASFSVNPHQTTFQLRPYQATTGHALPHVHPTMRLLGHFPCSLGCETTNARHGAILEAMAERLPAFHRWVAPAFHYPVLFLDHDGAVFEGTASGSEVRYRTVWHGDARPAEPDSLRDHLNRGNRATVDGPWVRVFDGSELLGEHDTRDRTLLPLFLPVDGSPIGKRLHHIAVPDHAPLARFLAGDLTHLGYRADLVDPARDPAAFVEAARARGVDTLVLTAAQPELVEHAVSAGLTVVSAGLDQPGSAVLPTDRHAFADAFERLSRGLDPTPADAPARPGDPLAQPHLDWPAALRIDLLTGKLRAVDGSGTPKPQVPDVPDPTPPAPEPAAPAAPEPQPASEAVRADWVRAAVDRLAALEGNPFARVAVLEQEHRVVVVGHPPQADPVGIGIARSDARWRISADRPLTEPETKWLKAIRALLERRRLAER